MFFSTKTRPTIVAEFPDMPFGDVGKTVGERWRALTDQERQPYLDRAEEDKQRYAEEMANCTFPGRRVGRESESEFSAGPGESRRVRAGPVLSLRGVTDYARALLAAWATD
jgi:hypothetical protein